MTYVQKSGPYNMVAALISEWNDRRNRRTIIGSRKLDEVRAEGAATGYECGVATGLAVMLNALRMERYHRWEFVPISTETDMRGDLLIPAINKYDELTRDLPEPSMIREADKRKEATERLREAKDAWLQWCVDRFNGMVAPENLERQEQERHMQAVIAGTEEATEADRPWLQERLAKARKLQDELIQLMEPIQPKGRPIKDQPQA